MILKSFKIFSIHICITLCVCWTIGVKLSVLIFTFFFQATTEFCALGAWFSRRTCNRRTTQLAAAEQQRRYFLWANSFKALHWNIATRALLPPIGFQRQIKSHPSLNLLKLTFMCATLLYNFAILYTIITELCTESALSLHPRFDRQSQLYAAEKKSLREKVLKDIKPPSTFIAL